MSSVRRANVLWRKPGFAAVALALIAVAAPAFGQESSNGQKVEGDRFPPLITPPGFKATLFAADPMIEYPSVISVGPRVGSVFAARDYLTGLGVGITKRDEIYLLEDDNRDGVADKSTLVAGDFNSIQGLAWHGGELFVMHAPLLTVLRDKDGKGMPEERADLVIGIGLPPEKNPFRLHCANGVVVGHDGWLYLAVGDYGVDAQRPEGDRLVLKGGGILRCRRDGRDLHVFASGLRNIYDIALDEDLNVFVRDNENDGGDYLQRVSQSFFGADHGYPYNYYERPEEVAPTLAIVGRGSSAGGICYLESGFPPEYRGNLFFCEWGRAVVRYERKREGSSFAPMKQIDFLSGAPNDPYGFHPTDIVVDSEGAMYVSDWGDGQRPVRGRGRIYRVTYEASEAKREIARLESEGIWKLTKSNDPDAKAKLFVLAEKGKDQGVRAQAVRAIGDLTDPVLMSHRLNAGRGDAKIAERLSNIAIGADSRVALEVIAVLGRVRWKGFPDWLGVHFETGDATLDHAAMQTLRRADNWPAVLKLLDHSDTSIRDLAMRAIGGQADEGLVDALISRLLNAKNGARKFELADAVTRVHRLPGAQEYWGYRPAPRPAPTVKWARTNAMETTLNGLLADSDHDLRVKVLRRMQREGIPERIPTLASWLYEERASERVEAILDSLAKSSSPEAHALLSETVLRIELSPEIRLRALADWKRVAKPDGRQVLEVAEKVEDGPVLVDVIDLAPADSKAAWAPYLIRKLDSKDASVLTSTLLAAARLQITGVSGRLVEFLGDADAGVRRAAVVAAGALAIAETRGALLSLAIDPEAEIRAASLVSLRQLREPGAVAMAVKALENPATQGAALEYLGEFGGPEQTEAVIKVAMGSRSADILAAVVSALAKWETAMDDESTRTVSAAIARVQGISGVLARWRVLGPFTADEAKALGSGALWNANAQLNFGTGLEARVSLAPPAPEPGKTIWLAGTEFHSDAATGAQFLASSNGRVSIHLNGKLVYERMAPREYRADSDRISCELRQGTNRLVVRIEGGTPSRSFHVRFRPVSSSAEHERLTQFVLSNEGDVNRGRTLFTDIEKSLCLRCHRLGNDGGTIGPNLTGVGGRFSRVHLVESILNPSQTIAPSYETISVLLDSGRVVSGVKVLEDESKLIIGNENGKQIEIRREEIEERQVQPLSTMPAGLEKRFTDRDLIDLIAFLLSQKQPIATGAPVP